MIYEGYFGDSSTADPQLVQVWSNTTQKLKNDKLWMREYYYRKKKKKYTGLSTMNTMEKGFNKPFSIENVL